MNSFDSKFVYTLYLTVLSVEMEWVDFEQIRASINDFIPSYLLLVKRSTSKVSESDDQSF